MQQFWLATFLCIVDSNLTIAYPVKFGLKQLNSGLQTIATCYINDVPQCDIFADQVGQSILLDKLYSATRFLLLLEIFTADILICFIRVSGTTNYNIHFL